MNDGSQKTIEQGISYTIPPGHDAWVEGNEPFVCIEVGRRAICKAMTVHSATRAMSALGQKATFAHAQAVSPFTSISNVDWRACRVRLCQNRTLALGGVTDFRVLSGQSAQHTEGSRR
jgi:hypothetical protein